MPDKAPLCHCREVVSAKANNSSGDLNSDYEDSSFDEHFKCDSNADA